MSPPKSGSASRDATNRASTRLQTSLSKGKGTATSSGSEESVTENEPDPVEDQTPIGPEPDVVTLMRELALLRAELAQLKTQQPTSSSVAPDQPLPTTETPPISTQPTPIPRFHNNSSSPTPDYSVLSRRSEKTPNINDLSDGKEPSFKQWQASIQDRLEVNEDHYKTERARMALVWGHTTGLAKEYLEPRYLSDEQRERFTDAEQMIDLLKSYFITGNEKAESRAAFDRLQMDKNESFPTFKSRFLSAAVRGQVPRSEWFHYLWSKITPAMRVPNLGFKHLWHDSFEQMVEHLTAFDMERKNYPNPVNSVKATPPFNKSHSEVIRKPEGSSPRISSPQSHHQASRPGVTFQRQPSAPPAPERAKTPGSCYNCGEPGHYVSDCPKPRIRKMEVTEELEDYQDAVEEPDSDLFRMGKGNAREDSLSRA